MRVCVLYDCLFPWTIGGAERWYRQIAEAHAARGDEVTYLTLRQWDHGDAPDIPGVQVVAVGPRQALYCNGRRRILPPLRYGIGVFWHLLRHGRRYDVVHGASFPFFSVLAAAFARRFHGFRIVVDWHEVWTRKYWHRYLGWKGRFGWQAQRLCAAVPQLPFAFSRLHAARAEALGVGPVTVLEGEYAGEACAPQPADQPPFVLYAGRMIPEKRVGLLVRALSLLMREDPALRAVVLGRGPELATIRAMVAELGLSDRIALPGFVEMEEVDNLQSRCAVIVQPSEREGYGMVVVEASAHGVPVVVVAGEDNAAVELVEEGVNGFVAPRADAEALAGAIGAALAGGEGLRERVGQWYGANAGRLSFAHSFERIVRTVER